MGAFLAGVLKTVLNSTIITGLKHMPPISSIVSLFTYHFIEKVADKNMKITAFVEYQNVGT